MTSLLMPKATAVWLIDNTTLTFEQIAEFCSLHVLEVQAIADGDVGHGILGFDPILNGQLTQEEIDKCCNDTSLFLTKSNSSLPEPKNKNKGPKYIPLARRGDKPDAIASATRFIAPLSVMPASEYAEFNELLTSVLRLDDRL